MYSIQNIAIASVVCQTSNGILLMKKYYKFSLGFSYGFDAKHETKE